MVEVEHQDKRAQSNLSHCNLPTVFTGTGSQPPVKLVAQVPFKQVTVGAPLVAAVYPVAQTAEQLVAVLLHVSGHVALLTCKEGSGLQSEDSADKCRDEVAHISLGHTEMQAGALL
jgi:hypothetical protein